MIAGRYRLLDTVGSGAMGVVWQARDERLDRTVAIKQLLVRPGLSAAQAEDARRRAMREARIAARLQHRNAVALFDVAEHDGDPCLIMEYLASSSLAVVLSDRGKLPPHEVAEIGSQAASALAAAHAAGIVHRDVKPGNILITHSGTVKITDFGISRALDDTLTQTTGMLAGTPAYLAPEVAKGQTPGPASDVFSLGATLYHAVEGQPPYGFKDNPLAQLYAVAMGEPPKPQNAGPLTEALASLLHKEESERPSMKEACDALAEVATGRPSAPPLLASLPKTRVVQHVPVVSRSKPPASVKPGNSSRPAATRVSTPSAATTPVSTKPVSPPPPTKGTPAQSVSPQSQAQQPPPTLKAASPARPSARFTAPTPPSGVSSAGGSSGQPRRTLLVVAAIVAAAALGGTVAAVALSGGDDTPSQGQGQTPGQTQQSQGSTQEKPESGANQPSASDAPRSAAPSATSPGVSEALPDGSRAATFVVNYYFGTTPEQKWNMLTPNAQAGFSGGWPAFLEYWTQTKVNNVCVSNCNQQLRPSGTVMTVPIQVTYDSGVRVNQVRVVTQGGQLLIDDPAR